jgi:hypothetical protein
MAKETTNAGKLGRLQKFSDALVENSGDLPHLEGSSTQLGTLVSGVKDSFKRQASLAAEKQETSKQLKVALTEGERLGNVLRLAVKQHYGIRSEKLTEFGLQPFRGRTRKAKPEDPENPTPTELHPKDPAR